MMGQQFPEQLASDYGLAFPLGMDIPRLAFAVTHMGYQPDIYGTLAMQDPPPGPKKPGTGERLNRIKQTLLMHQFLIFFDRRRWTKEWLDKFKKLVEEYKRQEQRYRRT